MSSSPIEIAIDQISKRLDALASQVNSMSTFGPKTWIPIGLSIVAIGISIYTLKANRDQSKASRLQGIKNSIDACKASIESISMQLAELKAKKSPTADEKRELQIKNQVLEAALERLLNAYENGCDSFFKGEVNKQHFVNMFNIDISQYVTQFPEKFTPPLTSFENMIKYYSKLIKKPKA